MDAQTGQILYQKNMDTKMYPASITKIMTGMLALKFASLSDVITMSYDAVFSIDRSSSHIALDVNEQITLEQALYALSIESANDAANGIAELVGGTMDQFVSMMNEAAKAAGANNTNFTNAHGLPDENHYTTAYDMAKITAEALSVPQFSTIFGARKYQIPPTNIQPETRYFGNRNKLINGEVPYDGIVMSKTGWTSDAQHTLVSVAQKNDVTLIAVVLKSPKVNDKWNDTVALLDYGYEQYYRTSIPDNQIKDALAEHTQAIADIEKISVAPLNIPILLPAGKSNADLKIEPISTQPLNSNVQSLPLCVQVVNASGNNLELQDVTVTLDIQSTESSSAAQNNIETQKNNDPTPSTFPWSLLYFLLVILLLILFTLNFLICKRKREMIKRRRRRNKRYYN